MLSDHTSLCGQSQLGDELVHMTGVEPSNVMEDSLQNGETIIPEGSRKESNLFEETLMGKDDVSAITICANTDLTEEAQEENNWNNKDGSTDDSTHRHVKVSSTSFVDIAPSP